MNVEIRTIPGYEPYGASADGRIWSPHTKDGMWREMKSSLDGCGYPKVNMGKITRRIHGLVAYAFLGPRPPRMDINHIDGVKTNPRAENLEYCTRSENCKHAYRLGLATPRQRSGIRKPRVRKPKPRRSGPPNTAYGERVASHKLSFEAVLTIKERVIAGERGKDLAVEYGISAAQVSRIVRGQRWSRALSESNGSFGGAMPIAGNSMGACSPDACTDFGGLV